MNQIKEYKISHHNNKNNTNDYGNQNIFKLCNEEKKEDFARLNNNAIKKENKDKKIMIKTIIIPIKKQY